MLLGRVCFDDIFLQFNLDIILFQNQRLTFESCSEMIGLHVQVNKFNMNLHQLLIFKHTFLLQNDVETASFKSHI